MTKLQQFARQGQAFTRKRTPKPPVYSRRVRRVDTNASNQAVFVTKSFTNEVDIYHPVVDGMTGHVFCDCKGFHFHYEKHNPTIWDGQWHCCHLIRAIKNCRKRGELPLLQPVYVAGPVDYMGTCAICGKTDAEYPMCDDDGEPIPYRMCGDCLFPSEPDFPTEPNA